MASELKPGCLRIIQRSMSSTRMIMIIFKLCRFCSFKKKKENNFKNIVLFVTDSDL